MLRRSLVIAVVVGTILLAITQGDIVLPQERSPSLGWKVPLT